jgi:FtsP/CotA-like multicopper oxidase with cupredoxin domain
MDDSKKPEDPQNDNGITRREFVTQTVAATSALALAGALPLSALAATDCPKETLIKIGEIVAKGGRMKGVLKIKNGPRLLPGYTGAQAPMMRYFEGYDQQVGGNPPVWPKDKTGCFPGPTLRVGIGDKVEITFLNQVDVGAFPGGTLDNAETGATTGCDQATNATLAPLPPDKKWYPGTRGDSFPNCFHGSSTANLHFHGTHVSPDGFGDNVLVQVRPDPSITEGAVKTMFEEVFAKCSNDPPKWYDVPESFRKAQDTAVKEYDLHAIWKGVRGPVNGQPALPVENQLYPANEANLAHGLWPQYFVGAYPSCFNISRADDHAMGQAPGTHWYHSHKHGSTSINLFNGLAGALIIEGDYDKELAAAIPGLKQKVLVVQVFTALPDLELGATGGLRTVMTNGSEVAKANAGKGTAQKAPTIVMQPGEIQLWRIVNAQVQNRITNAAFTGPKAAVVSPLPKFRQVAQDGVQLNFANYASQPLTSPLASDPDKFGTKFTLAAGNRADILVQAPLLAAGATEASYELGGVVNLTVCGPPLDHAFPTAGNYPKFPTFLENLPEPRKKRVLSFDWEPYRIAVGPAANADPTANVAPTHSKTIPPDGLPVEVGNPKKTIKININRAPYYMVDEEQFKESKYYQTMILGDEEEWKIINNTIVPHPFHIHINPFQVIETYDPNLPVPKTTFKDGIWQDVIAVPSALKQVTGDPNPGSMKVDANGRAVDPGYVIFRTRFVDYPGSFVLHCHILAHEDRGMMQLVRVISGETTVRHH